MDLILRCKYCKNDTDAGFNGIHVCSEFKSPLKVEVEVKVEDANKLIIVDKLGCQDHLVTSGIFISSEQYLVSHGNCTECILRLMQVKPIELDWIYHISPDLYDRFMQLINKYKWENTTGTIWKCTYTPSDDGDEDGVNWFYDISTIIGKHAKFGDAERKVVEYFRANGFAWDDWDEEHLMWWLETLALKDVDFITAACKAYDIDLHSYDLSFMFSIACLNGLTKTARWLIEERRTEWRFSSHGFEYNTGFYGFELFPDNLLKYMDDYSSEYVITGADHLLDLILRTQLDPAKRTEILELMAEFYPDAFPTFNVPSSAELVASKASDSISMYYYEGEGRERCYNLERAISCTDLFKYCIKPNVALPNLNTVLWRDVPNALIETPLTMKYIMNEDAWKKRRIKGLPKDMHIDMIVPWFDLELYYGSSTRKNRNTYIVLAKSSEIIYIFKEDGCALQQGDAGTSFKTGRIKDCNYMFIDNYGDVESHILLVKMERPQAS